MKIIVEFDNTKDAKLAMDAPKLKSIIEEIRDYLSKMIEKKTDFSEAYMRIDFKLMSLLYEGNYEVDCEEGDDEDEET
jgi:hypothetical protein